jgi:hypothetical protein
MKSTNILSIAFAALFLVSCTYAPRSTNQTYTARQMAIGVTSQPNGMTSTTTAEQSPVIATYPEVRVAEPVISASSNFLTIGSTKNDVVRIQGTPIEVTKYAYSGEETWRYGYSFITLKNGLVYEWNNRCSNLKVKM